MINRTFNQIFESLPEKTHKRSLLPLLVNGICPIRLTLIIVFSYVQSILMLKLNVNSSLGRESPVTNDSFNERLPIDYSKYVT